MKKIIAMALILLFVFAGCRAEKPEEPGNAYPIMAQYEGKFYFFRGKLTKAVPEGYEYLGKINCVDTHSIEKDLDGNEEGYLYKNDGESDLLCFEYKEWDEELNGKKAPILFLERDED